MLYRVSLAIVLPKDRVEQWQICGVKASTFTTNHSLVSWTNAISTNGYGNKLKPHFDEACQERTTNEGVEGR